MDATRTITQMLETFFKKEALIDFENKLLLNESKMKNFPGFVKVSVIEGTFFMTVGMICGAILLRSKPEGFIGLGILAFILPFLVNYIFQDIIFEKRKREKEALLSDLLLEASVFCDESSLLNTLDRLAKQDFGLLSKDFARALNEIKKGASIDEALSRIKTMNKSRAYERAIDLLLQSYKNGSHVSQALKETAEDILENQAIMKERQAVMIVNKYTLLISSAIIVPAIIGTIISLVSGLNVSGIDEIGFGLSGEERNALFATAKAGALIYIIEYSFLASYFLALQEGNKKNFFIYAIILLPVALAVFVLCQIL